MSKDKYKDPVNKAILEEISEKVSKARNWHFDENNKPLDYYRIGLYAGMNITLKNLGREPL